MTMLDKRFHHLFPFFSSLPTEIDEKKISYSLDKNSHNAFSIENNIVMLDLSKLDDSTESVSFDLQVRIDGEIERTSFITVTISKHEPRTHNKYDIDPFYFYPADLPEAAQPKGEIKYILLGEAFVMPETGPVKIAWGLNLNHEKNGLVTPEKIHQALDYIERAIAEFEAVANIKFVQSTTNNRNDHDLTFLFTESVNYILGLGGNRDITIATVLDAEGLYSLLVHEMGHTLGLGHPGSEYWHAIQPEIDDKGAWPEIDDEDYSEWFNKSVMGPRDDVKKNALTELDKLALQYLYGKPNTNFDGVERKIGYDILDYDGRIRRNFVDSIKERIPIEENHKISKPIFNIKTLDSYKKYRHFKLVKNAVDNDLFDFNSDTGNVYFIESPDYENPQDSYGWGKFTYNNVYELQVQASKKN